MWIRDETGSELMEGISECGELVDAERHVDRRMSRRGLSGIALKDYPLDIYQVKMILAIILF
jgi:hypothetical protein